MFVLDKKIVLFLCIMCRFVSAVDFKNAKEDSKTHRAHLESSALIAPKSMQDSKSQPLESLESLSLSVLPQLLDYTTLDKKYYLFIRREDSFYDSEIKKIIHKVDIAQQKSGLFAGFSYGWNKNGYVNLLDSRPLENMGFSQINYSSLGLKIGFQSYIGHILPLNTMGYRIFLDLDSSFGAGYAFFSGINLGFLYDFLESKKGGFAFLLFTHIGLGGAKIAYNNQAGTQANNISKLSLALRLELGLGFRILHKTTINFSFNSIYLTENFGSPSTLFFSLQPRIGVEYVF